MSLRCLPPVGEKIPVAALLRNDSLGKHFHFTGYQGYFYQSGTAALAAALLALKQAHPQRDQVLIPAYCCPDLVSAIRFANLQPVLVDFLPESPFLDLTLLEKKINTNTLAVVAIHFNGIREQVARIQALCQAKSIALIEDSAQRSPWRSGDVFHGDFVVLSFGRGKPENALLGGAVLAKTGMTEDLPMTVGECSDKDSAFVWISYFLKACIFNLALSPYLFGLLVRLPLLNIGATTYKSLSAICPMPGYAKKVLAARLACSRPVSPAIAIYEQFFQSAPPGFVSLALQCGATPRYLLRYPVLMPNREVKQTLLKNWGCLGISDMYPSVLHAIAGLEWLDNGEAYPNAQDFARRVVTLPVYSRVTEGVARQIVHALKQAAEV